VYIVKLKYYGVYTIDRRNKMSKSQKIPVKGLMVIKAQVFERVTAPECAVSIYEVWVDSPIPQQTLFVAAYSDDLPGEVAYGSGRTPLEALEAASEVWHHNTGTIVPNPFQEAIKRFQLSIMEEVAQR